jgi:hypothetical protein
MKNHPLAHTGQFRKNQGIHKKMYPLYVSDFSILLYICQFYKKIKKVIKSV